MSATFDPYHHWLGIPPHKQPPNHYVLLGLSLFEDDLDVIDSAFERQLAHVQRMAAGEHAADGERLAKELREAHFCLLNPAGKEPYDSGLKESLSRRTVSDRELPRDNSPADPNPALPPTATRPAPAVPKPQPSNRPIPLSAAGASPAANPAAPNRPIPVSATTPIPVPAGENRPSDLPAVGEKTQKPAGKPIWLDPTVLEVGKVILGGAVGLVLALFVLKYGFNSDPFGLFPQPKTVVEQKPTKKRRTSATDDRPSSTDPPRTTDNSLQPGKNSPSRTESNSKLPRDTSSPATDISQQPGPSFVTSRFAFGTRNRCGVIEKGTGQYWIARTAAQGMGIKVVHLRESAKSAEMLELTALSNSDERWRLRLDTCEAPDNSGKQSSSLPGRWLGTRTAAVKPETLAEALPESWALYGKSEFRPSTNELAVTDAHVVIPTKLPRNYLLKASVVRPQGSAGLVLGLRLQDMPIQLVIDDGSRRISGIEGIGGQTLAITTSTTNLLKKEIFQNETPTQIAILVEGATLRLAVDGKEQFRYVVKPGELTFPSNHDVAPYPEHLWLSTRAEIVLRDLTLTTRPAPDDDERTRLLAEAQDLPSQILLQGNSLAQWDDLGSHFLSAGQLTSRRQLGGGPLVSKQLYDNFELQLELRLSSGLDGGILFGLPQGINAPTSRPTNRPSTSIPSQVSFIHNSTGIALGGYFHTPAPQAVAAILPDDWNTLTMRVWGGRIETFVNGVKAVETHGIGPQDVFPGRIGIELTRGELSVRRMELRPLPPLSNAPSWLALRRAGSRTDSMADDAGPELSPEDAQKLAVALERMKHVFATHASQLRSAKSEMIKDFEKVVVITKNAKNAPLEMPERLREERDAFEKAGYIPFSELMRQPSADFYVRVMKANQALADSFDQQVRNWRKEDEATAELVSAEKLRRLRPTLIGKWSYSQDVIQLYSDGTAKRGSWNGRWALQGKFVGIEWREANGFPLGVDNCTLDILGRTIEIRLNGRQFATAMALLP